MIKIKEKLRSWFKDITHESVSSHSIASGAALGTFIAILPTPGFNILLGIIVLLIYPKANKISLFAALAVWNPLTVAPFYLLSYKVGNFLFASEPIVNYNLTILEHIYNFSRRFLVGNFLVAFTAGILIYLIVRALMQLYRKEKR